MTASPQPGPLQQFRMGLANPLPGLRPIGQPDRSVLVEPLNRHTDSVRWRTPAPGFSPSLLCRLTIWPGMGNRGIYRDIVRNSRPVYACQA